MQQGIFFEPGEGLTVSARGSTMQFKRRFRHDRRRL